MSDNEKDLEKFVKALGLRMAQIVVQSRSGEKIHTECRPHAHGYDWFNLRIHDNSEITLDTKKVLHLNPGESIVSRLPLCIELSLKTSEGDRMILEVWSLSIHPERADPTVHTSHTIYTRMGVMLKSLIGITRATPAYKLSRHQTADSYHIFYRVYADEPQTHHLGEGCKQVRIGQLSTIFGTINMSVAYRTKMTISPTQTGRDTTIMLKSDHFLKDLSPKHNRYHIKKSEKKVIDIEKPLRPGAFADVSKIKCYTEDDHILPETPPFHWLLRKSKEDSSQETSVEDEKSSVVNSPDDKQQTNNNNDDAKNYESKNLKNGLHGSQKDISGTSPVRSLLTTITEESKKQQQMKTSKTPSEEEEKINKELHFPFATAPTTSMGDLAKFYADCFNAPPLHLYNDPPADEDEEVDEISRQLEQFETSLNYYDKLVTSLGSLDSNSNS